MQFTKGTLTGVLRRVNTEAWSRSKRQYIWQRKLQLVAPDGRHLITGSWNNTAQARHDMLQFGWTLTQAKII